MKRALTIQQMEVLVKLGIPTEKANRGYERSLVPEEDSGECPLKVEPGHPDHVWSDWKPVKLYRKWDNNPWVQSVPAFNIENMLEFLPVKIDVNYTLQMGTNRDGTWFARYHSGLQTEADDLLDALYELYLLCVDHDKLKDAAYENRK